MLVKVSRLLMLVCKLPIFHATTLGFHGVLGVVSRTDVDCCWGFVRVKMYESG